MKQQRVLGLLAATCVTGGMGSAVQAVPIDTGNPDIELRWDNTVRFNSGVRVDKRDTRIGDNSQFDESDYKFDRKDFVTNRIDLLSELDFQYQRRLGFRASAAAWYDAAYKKSVEKSPFTPTTGPGQGTSYLNREYSSYTKRYYLGPSGEILDAFVFGRFNLGEREALVRAGRHTVIWGESLFTSTQGISYAQSPTDGLKGATSPGIEAKELFLPLTQVSAQVPVSDSLTLLGQYFLEWKPARLPEGGTYLGAADVINFGPNVNRAPLLGPDDRVGRAQGNYGVGARWAPQWLDGGALSLFYRRFDDKNAWQMLSASPATTRPVYGKDVDLMGVSFSKAIQGISVGADLSYRHNTPLNSTGTGNTATGPQISPNGEGARGDTWHLVLNAQKSFSQTKMWDSMSLSGELVFSGWRKVTSNPSFFKAQGYAAPGVCPGPTGDVIRANCVTKTYASLQLSATPQYLQVFPGWDLSVPLSVGVGIHGNPSTLSGGNPEGAGSYRVALSFVGYAKYQIDLAWVDYFAKVTSGPGAIGSSTYSFVNGAAYNDRGWLSLTFKTTF